MKAFLSILSWIKDPKNRGIQQFILLTVVVAFVLMQCNRVKNLKEELANQKSESERVINNIEAKNSVLMQSKINDSVLLAEKLALKLTVDELKNGYSDLLVGFEKFRKQNPKVIEKITVNNHETIVKVPVYVKMDSLGNGTFAFVDSLNMPDGNFRKISGIVPFLNTHYYKKDSSQADINKLGLYSKVAAGPGSFQLEQRIKLKVGLFEDPKTKKVTIGATTSYPGITFSQLEGASIMDDPLSKKATKQFRKTWGLGFNLGWGATVNLKDGRTYLGPQVGISLHYTPKWLQWGK
jgi:hypothetical protein